MAELARTDQRRHLLGRVVAFDARVGRGTISGPVGDVEFHCIEIADGSRHVEVGTEVRFDLIAKLGRWEAGAIRW